MKERKVNLISVSGWDKLTEKQLLAIASLMRQPNYEKSLVTKAFLKINGLRVKKGFVYTTNADGQNYKSYIFQKNGYRPFTISANIFASMVKKLEWLDGEITPFRCLAKLSGRKAPNHLLFGTSLEQFLYAENLCNNYMATRQVKYLRQLAAVYYKPDKAIFKSEKVNQWAKKYRFVKTARLYAIFLWFSGIKQWIIKKYPYVFSTSGTGKQHAPDESILNLLSALNQGDITRNEKILKTHVHEAMYQLNLMAEKANDNV